MLVLYHGDTSVASAKVRLALAEKRLSFDSRLFNLRRGEHRIAEYLSVNPAGVVPTLAHDGLLVRESNVILEYLEDAFPEPPLMPKSPAAKAGVRLLLREADHLHEACSILSSAVKLDKMRSHADAAAQALARVSDPLKRDRQQRLLQQGFDAPDIGHALARYRGFIDLAASCLLRSEWLSGPSLGLADCAALPYVHRAESLGLDALWSHAPDISIWMTRMRARPSFESAIVSWAGASNPYAPSAELAARARAIGR